MSNMEILMNSSVSLTIIILVMVLVDSFVRSQHWYYKWSMTGGALVLINIIMWLMFIILKYVWGFYEDTR